MAGSATLVLPEVVEALGAMVVPRINWQDTGTGQVNRNKLLPRNVVIQLEVGRVAVLPRALLVPFRPVRHDGGLLSALQGPVKRHYLLPRRRNLVDEGFGPFRI